MNLAELLSLAVFTIFVENVVLVQVLGIGPFLDSSKKLNTALSMGIAVTVVMGIASLCTWVVNTYLLVPLGLNGFLQTAAFVLIIALLVRCAELLLQKAAPTFFRSMDIQFSLIATNCAVLGVALLNTQKYHGALMSAAYGVFAGLGFTLAIVLFASVREQLDLADCPKSFEGLPIALVTAGLLAMAFMGFSGLNLPLG